MNLKKIAVITVFATGLIVGWVTWNSYGNAVEMSRSLSERDQLLCRRDNESKVLKNEIGKAEMRSLCAEYNQPKQINPRSYYLAASIGVALVLAAFLAALLIR